MFVRKSTKTKTKSTPTTSKRNKKIKKKKKDKKADKAKSSPSKSQPTQSDQANDKELKSKLDEIKTLMNSSSKKGSTAVVSSDDEDDFLNSREVKDLLNKYNTDDESRTGLIKDGDAFKTRKEMVHELLLVEKAITRRKEKRRKSEKAVGEGVGGLGMNGKHVVVNAGGGTGTEVGADIVKKEKEAKKAEREKSYRVLIHELQEIEGRINSCRSSLQAKPE